MTRILAISGSLRRQSFNTALIHAAQELAPEGVEIELATLHGIPLYDGDLEQAEGVPEAVTELKRRIQACDGLLLVTPEYNNSIPGVFKNAIDWLSRPNSEIAKTFGDRPTALVGASLSGFGTLLSQTAWLPVLKMLGSRLWSGSSLRVAQASKLFDEQGKLTDEETRKRLKDFLAGFAEFTKR